MKNFVFRRVPFLSHFFKIEFSFIKNDLKRNTKEKTIYSINDIKNHIKNEQNKAVMFFKKKVYFFML